MKSLNEAQKLYISWYEGSEKRYARQRQKALTLAAAGHGRPKLHTRARERGRGAPTDFTPAPSGSGPDMENFGLRQVNREAERRRKKHARRVILGKKRKIRFEKTRERQSARELRIAAGEEKAGFLMAVIRSRPSRLRTPVTIVEQL